MVSALIQHIRLFFVALFLFSQATSHPLDPGISSEMAMRERHEEWMTLHGRVYSSIAEKEKRFRIFKEKLKYIDEFNTNADGASTKSYKLATNAFSDLTKEEFIASRTGFKRQLFVIRESSKSDRTLFSYENPIDVGESVDWRQHGAVTPIKDQQECGSCWAFAAVAALEGIYKIKTGKLVFFSEQNLVDCSRKNHACKYGTSIRAFKYVKSHGINSELDYPYVGKKQGYGHCNTTQGQSLLSITGHLQIRPGHTNSLMAAVKQQPVAVSIDSTGFIDYSGGIYDGGCSEDHDHEVTVIGYGKDESSGKDYWLVKNCWGVSWGEFGYMRLLMNETLCPITQDAAFPLL